LASSSARRFAVLLANTQIDRCDYGAAETVLSEILDQARDAADPTDRAFIYWTQSRLHSSQDEPELAGRYARLALTALEQTEHSGYIANAFILLATLENDQGHSTEARELVEQAKPVVQSSGNRYDLGRLELERGERGPAELSWSSRRSVTPEVVEHPTPGKKGFDGSSSSGALEKRRKLVSSRQARLPPSRTYSGCGAAYGGFAFTRRN
jgi:hypothetical protein